MRSDLTYATQQVNDKASLIILIYVYISIYISFPARCECMTVCVCMSACVTEFICEYASKMNVGDTLHVCIFGLV